MNPIALDATLINALSVPYWRVSVVDLTGSTQNDLKELLKNKNIKVGEVIVTQYQSAGRGRFDRSFDAPNESALLFSFFINPRRSNLDWGWIPLIAGYSVLDALKKIDASCEIKIKWPNDLLVAEKKIAGLLCEVFPEGIIVGIGLNVSMKSDQLPVSSATSLSLENFSELNRNILLAAILNNFKERLDLWDQGDDSIQALYCSASATLGKKVRIQYPDGRNVESIATGISVGGELIISDGAHVHAGDVIHLR